MERLITCLTELEKLKTVERGLNVGDRKESSAEHSWSCMLIADIVLGYIDEPLDRRRVLEYLLYHDLVEVYAGDARFNNPEELRLKDEKEKASMKKIISILPRPRRYVEIIKAYESRESREAQFAKAIDCLDSCVRNVNNDKMTAADGFTEELIRAEYMPHVSRFEFTRDLFEALMSILRKQNKL
jgi:putative hydrolase of HD superfamily